MCCNEPEGRVGTMTDHVVLSRVLAVAALAMATAIPATSANTASAAAIVTTAYTAVSPTRVLDSRIGLGVPASLATGSSFVLDIGGSRRCPQGHRGGAQRHRHEPRRARLRVRVAGGQVAQPTTSVINFESVGQTIANLVTVPMDATGRVAFFTQTGVDLIADVQGYYSPAPLSGAGRFKPMTPTRVLDTRLTNAIHTGPCSDADESVNIDFKPWGVAGDAIAVVLNVTVTAATAAGYWTVFAAGALRPVASNLNVTTVGQTIANQVITPMAGGSARSSRRAVATSSWTSPATTPAHRPLPAPTDCSSPSVPTDSSTPAIRPTEVRTSRQLARRSPCLSAVGPASRHRGLPPSSSTPP